MQVNDGSVNTYNSDKYVLDYTRKFFVLNVTPMGAVRMTQSDRWKTNPNHTDPRKRQRGAVQRYFAFKTQLLLEAKKVGYELGECLDMVYLIPMPKSWSNKKKEKMNGLPCKSKPDTDNITKAIKDTLRKEDNDIWYEKAEKRWAFNGSIIVFC